MLPLPLPLPTPLLLPDDATFVADDTAAVVKLEEDDDDEANGKLVIRVILDGVLDTDVIAGKNDRTPSPAV
jgi:hypothetical protein